MTVHTHAFEEKVGRVQTTKVRRENGLDHWDSDTLAYYLDNYPGHDLAVMFYAQWDTNSHQLAPYWNQIAHGMDAGSSQSKIIMALFDCELNNVHTQLCAAAGITHYPTMMFIGSGPFYDSDPFSKIFFGKKHAGMMGEAPIANTVKFQGNWQYLDSVKDWLKTMQALSRWHLWSTQGFGKKLRTFLLPSRKKNSQLPVGVPGGSLASSSGASGSSSTGGGASVAMLEKEVEAYKKATEDLTKVASRAATMMEGVLFGEDSKDMFTYLDQRKAWESTTYENLDDIYRACVLEVSLDYCQRTAEPTSKKVVNELLSSDLSEAELQKASENVETLIMEQLAKDEPYCAILDQCIATDMKDQKCRPKKCPFNNELACRLLNSCEDPSIIKEYADVLKLDVDALLQKA